jgi:hypothetical protein
MSLIRVTRGIPRFNIQIGPIQDAIKHNPTAILSVTDHLEMNCVHLPNYMWVPINEIGKTWGYMPFFGSQSSVDELVLHGRQTSFSHVGILLADVASGCGT